jgi:hypothetical protein
MASRDVQEVRRTHPVRGGLREAAAWIGFVTVMAWALTGLVEALSAPAPSDEGSPAAEAAGVYLPVAPEVRKHVNGSEGDNRAYTD